VNTTSKAANALGMRIASIAATKGLAAYAIRTDRMMGVNKSCA